MNGQAGLLLLGLATAVDGLLAGASLGSRRVRWCKSVRTVRANLSCRIQWWVVNYVTFGICWSPVKMNDLPSSA
jgi:hypothetical protein